jgi:hypothetical protein
LKGCQVGCERENWVGSGELRRVILDEPFFSLDCET